ncbi:MAG: efflux RND transporter periplasmic adaptor subunit [bacterium]|nr:efflux RND transporter periplasmic adaptor subunit [bacterium]
MIRFLLLIGFLLLSGCSTEQELTAARDIPAIPVKVTKVVGLDLERDIKATGLIAPLKEVTVSSEVGGRVKEANLKIGRWVNKGDILIKVDDELPKIALARAEAHLSQAKTALETARIQLQPAEKSAEIAGRNLERTSSLFTKENVSQSRLEGAEIEAASASAAARSAKTQIDLAKANLAEAEAGLSLTKKQLSDTVLTAPVSGFITRYNIEAGEMVAPGTPVADLIDISRIKVEIGLTQEEAVLIRKGQKVTFTCDPYPGEIFKGKISAIGPKARPASNLFPVEITARNPENKLRPGMVARVKIIYQTLRDEILIPQEVILKQSNQEYVFVAQAGEAEQRVVEVSDRIKGQALIRSGLTKGEILITSGHERIKDGDKIIEVGDDE